MATWQNPLPKNQVKKLYVYTCMCMYIYMQVHSFKTHIYMYMCTLILTFNMYINFNFNLCTCTLMYLTTVYMCCENYEFFGGCGFIARFIIPRPAGGISNNTRPLLSTSAVLFGLQSYFLSRPINPQRAKCR